MVWNIFQMIIVQDNPGIIGVMLYTPEGIPIKTTVDNTTAAQYQSLVSTLTTAAQVSIKHRPQQ